MKKGLLSKGTPFDNGIKVKKTEKVLNLYMLKSKKNKKRIV